MTDPRGTAASTTCADDALRAVLRGLLTTIGDKWTLVVIAALVEKEQRFTTIQRRIDGISHRLLTKTLRDLERDGLVTRNVYAEVPPRVEYALTPSAGACSTPSTASSIGSTNTGAPCSTTGPSS
jgi:DNA-binding HxlR family transcriptional regulator